MKYYENGIYPIGLVLSYDVESVNKEYWYESNEGIVDVPEKKHQEASTYRLTRRTDCYYAMAVGIVFNKPIHPRLAAHEAFHAASFMMDRLDIPLTDYSDEAWAYLIGWITDCIDKFAKENETD